MSYYEDIAAIEAQIREVERETVRKVRGLSANAARDVIAPAEAQVATLKAQIARAKRREEKR